MKIPYKFRALVEGGKYEDKEFLLPTEWKDLTFDQGSRLFTEWFSLDKKNIYLLLSILSGIEVFYWENATGDIEKDIISRIQFINHEIDLDAFPFPEKMKIGDKEIPLPKNLWLETFGQKTKLHADINAAYGKPHDLFLIIPTAVATYAYPAYYNAPIDGKRLKTFIELVKQANFLEVYSAGKFFFLKSLKSLTTKP